MILQLPHENLMRFLPLFSSHRYFRSQLEAIPSYPIGKGLTDNLENPNILLYSLGNLWFLAGNRKSPRMKELLEQIPEKQEIFVPNQEWVSALKNRWKYVGFVPRTRFSAKDITLDSLQKLIEPLPEGFKLQKVDLETAKQVEYAQDYPGGPESFIKEAEAFCIKANEKVICWAAAFTLEQYEISVVTSPEYRGQGLAVLACAKLIEYCLERSIKPNWNASNEISVRMALKLGFTQPEPYRTYFWRKEPWRLSEAHAFFNPRFHMGIEELDKIKVEGKGSYTKAKTIFRDIMAHINRLIEPQIIDKPTEAYLQDLKKKTQEKMDELEQTR